MPLFLQEQDGGGREHLRERREVKALARRVRHLELVVRHPVRLAEQDVVAARHEDRAGEVFAFDEGADVGVDLRGQLRVRRGTETAEAAADADQERREHARQE